MRAVFVLVVSSKQVEHQHLMQGVHVSLVRTSRNSIENNDDVNSTKLNISLIYALVFVATEVCAQQTYSTMEPFRLTVVLLLRPLHT